ncbi:ABC transporter substrate-binding protein [Paenibacillus sedimenti]|uniref:SgrR family transcriptional regulator n=1 Tax=Paenibacillus sedimenti TaxID=2770274 RepID=A0A926KJD2_9BACL|nr:ABC transporter substrate-binding protein [Paenibacillus sedimenti]MBD0378827.1 SgrR family transcriptional regulator [Paenibacillus sedimenti]
MQTTHHFLELRLSFADQAMNTPFPVTVEKLTGIWHCSPRYAKLIVRKLCELSWIGWQAGQGRGHTSVMTLLTDADDILLEEVKNRMGRGDIKEAMELMNRYGGTAVKDQVMDWLSEGMGFSTQTISNMPQDTLRFPAYRNIFTLDPGLVYYAFDFHMTGQIFNTLVEYDPESRTIIPCIAHSWESDRNALEWTLHLKKGVMFHHGRELTADDVVYSIQRLRMKPEHYEAGWMFQDIERIEAMDHKTVRIRLKEPNYLFLRFLCAIPASIVPEDIGSKSEADFAKNPVGTGPFRLVRLSEGICVLEAFPLHFRGRPHLDRVEVLIFPKEETGRLKEPDWTSVMSGDGDATHMLKKSSIRQDDDWHEMENLFSCCSLLVFNQWKTGPQNHYKFRQAMHHILDRQQMIADLGDNLIYPGCGFRPLLPASGNTAEDPPLDHDEIMALLDASGYNGETFRLATNYYHQEEAAWIEERCRSFGIHVETYMKMELADLNHSAALPEHDGQLFGYVLNNDEVRELEVYAQRNFFLSAFDEQLAANVKRTMHAIFREPDEKERQSKLGMLEDLVRQKHAVLFLVHTKSNTAFHKSVRGVSINAYGWLDFHKIWFHPQINYS